MEVVVNNIISSLTTQWNDPGRNRRKIPIIATPSYPTVSKEEIDITLINSRSNILTFIEFLIHTLHLPIKSDSPFPLCCFVSYQKPPKFQGVHLTVTEGTKNWTDSSNSNFELNITHHCSKILQSCLQRILLAISLQFLETGCLSRSMCPSFHIAITQHWMPSISWAVFELCSLLIICSSTYS